MRSGVCSIQQTLTAEAASVVKHSLLLARKRGHAQLTPLHVAATLLTLSHPNLRRACLASANSSAQCRALELCFNVALNRLPTATTPIASAPSLSNALVAALKRAQAHQRRGCSEPNSNSQAALLGGVRVEVDQLLLSILDDPSVSRVMREAGLSSSSVKSAVEDQSFPLPPPPTTALGFWAVPGAGYSKASFSVESALATRPVFEVLASKTRRRNAVLIGESDGVVAEISSRFERGHVPDELRRTRFVKLHFSRREDLEGRVLEMKRIVESLVAGCGVVMYVGDLKWTVVDGDRGVDRAVEEIAKLVDGPNVWLMGSASYETYFKCQMRKPSLELQWGLQAVSVPSSSGLGFSLHANSMSVHDSRIMLSQNPAQLVIETKPLMMIRNKDIENQSQTHHLQSNNASNYKLNCCSECASNCEKEAELMKTGNQKLPAWLQPHGTETPQKDEMLELRKKWSRLCHSLHQGRHTISIQNDKNTSYNNNNNNNNQTYNPWWPGNQTNILFHDNTTCSSVTFSGTELRRPQACTIDFGRPNRLSTYPSLDSLRSIEGKEEKITLALGNSDFPKIKSTSSVERDYEMCKILKENVPWQSEAIPSVVQAVIAKHETWLLLQGNDNVGKRRLARAIAESVLGSAESLLSFDMSRRRSLDSAAEVLVLEKAVRANEKLVVLVEDIDSAGSVFLGFLSERFAKGKLGGSSSGRLVFVLTKTGPNRGGSRGSCCVESDHTKCVDSVIRMRLEIGETMSARSSLEGLVLDRKRKAVTLDAPKRCKRIKDNEDNGVNNVLDLNVEALAEDEDEVVLVVVEEEEEDYDDEEEVSPNSSDLTRETMLTTRKDNVEPSSFLESIEHVLVFNRSPARDREAKEIFEAKMVGCFGEAMCGKKEKNCVNFSVDESVLEEVSFGSSCFTNSLFEKWVIGVFQNALKTVRFSGKEKGCGGVVVRLCLGGGKEEGINLVDGFMGSCLPNKIQISYKD